MRDFILRCRDWLISHWKIVVPFLFVIALVLILFASCQGLANFNGDGNNLVIGDKNTSSTEVFKVNGK